MHVPFCYHHTHTHTVSIPLLCVYFSFLFSCCVLFLVFSYLISRDKNVDFLGFSSLLIRSCFTFIFIIIIESKRIYIIRLCSFGEIFSFCFVVLLFQRILSSKSWVLIAERVPTVLATHTENIHEKTKKKRIINKQTNTNEWISNAGWKYLQNFKRAKHICCEDQQKAQKIRLWTHI